MRPVPIIAAAALAACVLLAGPLKAANPSARGLGFDSPQVLDLSGYALHMDGGVVPVATLSADAADQILSAPTIDAEHPGLPFSDDVYGCTKPSPACSQQHEHGLIQASAGSVHRDGKTLTIQSTHGAPATLVDWTMPETKSADGDQETHWYLGRMAGSGYHRVEAEFGHDSPGSFLINPANGSVVFVHNIGDVTGLAPDGMHLLEFNADNPPLSVRVAALDAEGPSLQLLCNVGKDGDEVHPQFKGWQNAQSFDLALEIRAAHSKLAHRIAMSLTRDAHGWTLAAPDVSQLDAIGFACQQAHAAVSVRR